MDGLFWKKMPSWTKLRKEEARTPGFQPQSDTPDVRYKVATVQSIALNVICQATTADRINKATDLEVVGKTKSSRHPSYV